MCAALRRDNTLRELKSILNEEGRAYGCSYLSDQKGRRAEKAFQAFAELVLRQNDGRRETN
jgi:hypothetical protein